MAYGTGQGSAIYSGMAGGRKRRSPMVDRILAARGQATADVIARKKREQEAAEQQFDQRVATDQLDLMKQQNKEAADAEKRATGIQLGTLGLNIAGRSRNANVNKGLPGFLNKGVSKLSGGMVNPGINLGSLAGAGIAGYGAYKATGDNKLAGMGAGLLTDYVGGGVTKKLFDKGFDALSTMFSF